MPSGCRVKAAACKRNSLSENLRPQPQRLRRYGCARLLKDVGRALFLCRKPFRNKKKRSKYEADSTIFEAALEAEIAAAKDKCYRYNALHPNDRAGQAQILSELLGGMGENICITPPFWCDYGYNIYIGDFFYSNHNLIITDGAEVRFGNHVFVAPNCCFTTADHALDAAQRRAGMEVANPIRVGNDVWIGAGTTVLAGAAIGDGTVIGAGSVVKGNIPAGVLAAGVPCRVLRKITEEDKRRYPTVSG